MPERITMENIEIKNRFTGEIIIAGKYTSIKDCLEKNRGVYLRGADLRGAYLRGADLRGAYLEGVYLRGADLEGADLGGAKEYKNSHDFFAELTRRHSVKDFTQEEWAIIGQICILRLCWGTITKDYKGVKSIFEKLAKDGFDEFLKEFDLQCQKQ